MDPSADAADKRGSVQGCTEEKATRSTPGTCNKLTKKGRQVLIYSEGGETQVEHIRVE